MRGREGKDRKEGIKDGEVGRGRDRKENVSWLPYQSICSMKMNLNVIWMSSYAS